MREKVDVRDISSWLGGPRWQNAVASENNTLRTEKDG